MVVWLCVVLVGCTIWLPCLLDLFLLILVQVHKSVFCPIVPPFPCICWSVVVHTLYHVFFIYYYYYYYYHYYYYCYLLYAEYLQLHTWNKNNVSRLHNVAAALYLESVLHVILFSMLNMFCTFTRHYYYLLMQIPSTVIQIYSMKVRFRLMSLDSIW